MNNRDLPRQYRTPHQRWALHNRLRDAVYAEQDRAPASTPGDATDTTVDGCYRVSPGFFAGEYPAYRYDDDPVRLSAFLDVGVTHFIDLTEVHERSFSSRPLYPYEPLLHTLASQRSMTVSYERYPVRDRSIPSPSQMRCILDSIDTAQAAGQMVYVHCMGGVGRTGTVVGCHLVRHGSSPEEALRFIASKLYYTHKAERLSPEVDEQRAMVLRWQPGQ